VWTEVKKDARRDMYVEGEVKFEKQEAIEEEEELEDFNALLPIEEDPFKDFMTGPTEPWLKQKSRKLSHESFKRPTRERKKQKSNEFF
jgi:hypothetical protein